MNDPSGNWLTSGAHTRGLSGSIHDASFGRASTPERYVHVLKSVVFAMGTWIRVPSILLFVAKACHPSASLIMLGSGKFCPSMMGAMEALENKEAAAGRVNAAELATRATAKAGIGLYMFLVGGEVCRFASGVAQQNECGSAKAQGL